MSVDYTAFFYDSVPVTDPSSKAPSSKEETLVDMGLTTLLTQLKSLDIAQNLVQRSPLVRSLLAHKEGLGLLQDALETKNSWRRLTDVRTPVPRARDWSELLRIYQTHYISANIFFTHKDWLDILFRYADYHTLTQIVTLHAQGKIVLKEEEIARIRQTMALYPLTVFPIIWLAIGQAMDLVSVLQEPNLRAWDKERYLQPLLKDLTLSKQELRVLLRAALLHAPSVFRELYKKDEKVGKEVLSEKINISVSVGLAQLQIIESSLLAVLPEKEAVQSARAFGQDLLRERLQGVYSSQARDVAWFFLSTYLQEKNDPFLLTLHALENADNKLWLQERVYKLLQ